jgi:hypothetical protein
MNTFRTIEIKEDLNLEQLSCGEIHRLKIHLTDSALGVPWRIPVTVIKGVGPGPVLGITAAVHGDELNGISTIFKLIKSVDPKKLKGTLVMVPISNVPGYLKNQRHFSDNVDLNRIMPGKKEGSTSNLYAHAFIEKIVKKFNILLDLHTASYGRINSLYIRSDLDVEETRTLAYLQHCQIIVSKDNEQGTLRSWANQNNIDAITIEIGNSNAFQHKLIDETLDGILNTLYYYKMLEGEVKDMITDEVIVCDRSFWIYSTKGGIVDVFPGLTETVSKGDVIANIYDVFGDIREQIKSNYDGVVIGKNVSPSCSAGTRILHLGTNIIEPMPETVPGTEEFDDTHHE